MNADLSFGKTVLLFILGAGMSALRAAEPAEVPLRWLEPGAPSSAQPVSWGVPWPQGAVMPDTTFALRAGANNDLPVQTWALAWWPDGSLKWSGHAATVPAGESGELLLVRGTPATPEAPLRVSQAGHAITVTSGNTVFRLAKQGSDLVESIEVEGRVVARAGRLVAMREDRSDYASRRVLREEDYTSEILSTKVEQDGPVRAVVKVEGRHKADGGSRAWLPFVVRFYFAAGSDQVRIVHSVIFDGDQQHDYIKGLGVRFAVPMREEEHNRHVRLAGEPTGVFAEPVRLVAGSASPGAEIYRKQIAGERVPPLAELRLADLVRQLPVWNDFKLSQVQADGFVIEKRTGDHSAWIEVAGGTRAQGLAFVGDASGGIALGMKNFWQLHPTGIEVANGGSDAADLTLWLWSPDSPAMDVRHYSDKEHGLRATYEDIEPGFSTATGIARTTELVLQPFGDVPANATLVELARTTHRTPLLICAPEHYHAVGSFGVWSLPDRSTPAKRWFEEQLDRAYAYYQGQVEQRRWYGFWDFGDIMHTYDPTRREWRYDVGGFAWANTELMPDLWLWYGFLRTGRADLFRMAEAMTRHTQEVDSYHLGRFKGLGTRHNVRHWGDGAKEARVAQAWLKRHYYYLTTDERTGDLIDEVVHADLAMLATPPLRKVDEPSDYPVNIRVGPDWFALAGNWFTAWERTGDTKYRDWIVTGMKSMAAMPQKLFTSFSYGYDPETKALHLIKEQPQVPHLAALMGGPELMMEITPLLDVPEWNEAWLHYSRYLGASAEEQEEAFGGRVGYGRQSWYARMSAYAAVKLNDPALAARAWESILSQASSGPAVTRFDTVRYEGPDVPRPVDEIPTGVTTNNTAQWGLNVIQLLELVGDELPATLPDQGADR
jgi:hypothetical protein